MMREPRWSQQNESEFPWEREALAFLREHLPDRDPWRAWANFEFIDDTGKVREVDVLVLSPCGLFLIEIKSRPGAVSGDTHTWTWTTEGRQYIQDNPLILANRKAKRLASLLRRQPAIAEGKVRLPRVQEMVFLSAQRVERKLGGAAAEHVHLRGRPGTAKDDGIVATLSGGAGSGLVANLPVARAVCRAVAEAGIRPSNRHKRIGDYELGRLLEEGDNWQDWDGKHVGTPVHRRIRVYPYAATTSEPGRETLRTLAARQFRLLQDIDHPGILRVLEYKESERGPALFFQHDPNASRLDFLIREHSQRMDVDLRLHLLRRLAETLKYAHEKRLFHLALSPHSILITDTASARPHVQIMNWHTAMREGSKGGTGGRTLGTFHPEDHVEDPARLYMAPEATHGTQTPAPYHDVFSLGAVAFHLFTGQPPADSPLDLAERLRGGGLHLSDAMDGASEALQTLVRMSTHPDVSVRLPTMDEFLAELAKAEDELRRPTADDTVDPAEAKAGDRLDGGFTVVRRLGRGASADALLITRNGVEDRRVLKVAIDAKHNDRLKSEGDVLRRLHHQNIVRLHEALAVAGRTALLMESAGDRTLAQRLREERPSLDLAQRYGEDLLSAVDYLEEQGIAHRDIKPDNIGVAGGKSGGKLHLVLFDFSLNRTSADNIRVGTPPYLDPFLPLRRPPRWDLAAERYAAAVTLYEMLTGAIPVWGDGRSDPSLLDCEVTLDPERFDPNLRDAFVAFFAKAFRRDPAQRFDNAEEMRRAWRQAFEMTRPIAFEADSIEAIARDVTWATSVEDLGYGIEARNVLDRMGVRTVRDLLNVDRAKFRYLTGVGDRVRKEIRLRAKRLAQLRPDLVPGQPSVLETETADGAAPGVDRLAGQLLPRRVAGDDHPADGPLAMLLGLENGTAPAGWPTVGDVADRLAVDRPAVADALVDGRQRWGKLHAFTALRDDMATLVAAQGGAVTAHELADQILTARGCAPGTEVEPTRLALAVLRAAGEVEADRQHRRFQIFPGEPALIAETEEAALYALDLGTAADGLADLDPLPSPQRALETLETVWLDAKPALAPQRLMKLATAVAGRARLSSRNEIYPAGMPAVRAVRLALGSLAGPRALSVEDIRRRVTGRYPEAEPLPDRPALDRLLTEAGADLKWDRDSGGYLSPSITAATSGTSVVRHRTQGPAEELTPEIAEARAFEEKLAYVLKAGGFMALTCDTRDAGRAEAELSRRNAHLARLSFDRLLLDAMQDQAKAKTIDWSVVLKADGSGRGSRDWPNLMRLVGLAAPVVEARLEASADPVLLVHPGLIARYDLMGMLVRLAGAAGTPGRLPALVALVPMPLPGPPMIDGAAVPVIGTAQWATVPRAWIANAHRAGTRAA